MPNSPRSASAASMEAAWSPSLAYGRYHLPIPRVLKDKDRGVDWRRDSQTVEFLLQTGSTMHRPQLVGEHPAGNAVEVWECLRRRGNVVEAPPCH
jgi:hypothetical protein